MGKSSRFRTILACLPASDHSIFSAALGAFEVTLNHVAKGDKDTRFIDNGSSTE